MIRTLKNSVVILLMEKLNRAETIMMALVLHGHDHNTMYVWKHCLEINAYCDTIDDCEKIENIVRDYTKALDRVEKKHLVNEDGLFYYVNVLINLGDRFEEE